uniref:Secreted protein n=1 Tax=Aegilops tauschii subsp. strangulata TaxID=200361 RepID=A0A453ARV3_AEGTS
MWGYLVRTRQLALLSCQLSFLVSGGSTRQTGMHHRSSVETKLRREGVWRILQGATVPILLMVVSDPNRYKFSGEKESLQTCLFLLVYPNRHWP